MGINIEVDDKFTNSAFWNTTSAPLRLEWANIQGSSHSLPYTLEDSLISSHSSAQLSSLCY
ncbi:hypothetical protein SLEP1_g43265 [Rubroshorea leprosula]|uniref:Uncharacterized protein n=1 Tax=Rubroshorea leprosula TaxID=152421 RepID=A0AAV5LCF6_9ROSI|nr:hypothetical protein SLEP1_g43265 [Rubroshorea leprosula]